MTRIALTDRFVAGARPDATGRTDYFDTTALGLALRVTKTHKSWTYNFTSPKDGKRARLTLGSYPALTLAKARGLALEAKGYAEDGTDPRDVRAAQDATAMTLADLIDSYLEKHAKPGLRSAADIERRLGADVLPVIGAVKVADLHKRDINRVLDPIVARDAPVQARVVFQNLRAVLRWAVSRGDLDHSPMEGMKSPNAELARERVLSDDEVRVLWNGLPNSLAKSKSCQRIVRLCLITGQRVGEVSGMRSDELDLSARLWSLPGRRTKNGHPHTVPLSDLAISVIEEALRDAGKSPFVFPIGEDGFLSPAAVSRTIGRANETNEENPVSRFGIAHFTAHDLRRTAVTGMARLGVAPTVLGFVANHRTVTRGGVTMAVYVQHSFDKEKRQALELWADRLGSVVDGSGAEILLLKGNAHG